MQLLGPGLENVALYKPCSLHTINASPGPLKPNDVTYIPKVVDGNSDSSAFIKHENETKTIRIDKI